MQKFVTNLWFNDNAEDAAKFYISVFKNSKITRVLHYSKYGAKAAKMPEGSVMTVEFELDGQHFILINGGPAFKLSEACSILVNCKNQAEIDKLWKALTADGGEESYCGWLKDKFGLSWQIIPEYMNDIDPKSDPVAFERMMQVMYETKGKLNLAKLEEAYEAD
jgi:predicted 3-demethylubiquinone-9 3-methyltransferase (glyoxalase superfamily)